MIAATAAVPGFVGGTLDRADQVRSDPVRLAEAFADRRARMLLLDGLDPVVDGAAIATASLPEDAEPTDFVLLGIGAAGPVFAYLDPALGTAATYAPKVWAIAPLLSPDQLALYGTARSLIDWHARHGFCARCGTPTVPSKAGWARRCGGGTLSGSESEQRGCGAEHFPRVDPVTIMLAEHDGRVLVGRQPRFPAGRYSALAGFVEPGETIEEAVARELWEEAGIVVENVRYAMSQPWPFPSSLMIACVATARDDALTIDMTEIEDAMWVTRDEVRAALAGEAGARFLAPPEMAVAYHLFRFWLGE
ncbi:NAD(+) diphosphatase [Sphingobium algorifonticola]|uniref:NAD(+) diphosphatase n=1 Tax=Sphingobium algorifonticola TaxID=2008318 RepID=A0A437JC65_9SPHN|nr:NAD(+) diphosphatase [Sphingobium algorifonticola]RVT43499.1 NAD(+) diphosphatase [Sphingobium algorifonticola]